MKILNWLFKKEPHKNIWKDSLPVLESMDPEKYNCMMMVDGKMTYGWIKSNGPTYIFGYNNHAQGIQTKIN